MFSALDSRSFLALSLFTLACGNAEPPATPAPSGAPSGATAEPTEALVAEAAPPRDLAPEAPTNLSGPNAEGDDAACVRAEPCCRAFVEAIGDPAEANRARAACESLSMVEALGGAANDACANAIAGWRQALIADEREVPSACAASLQ